MGSIGLSSDVSRYTLLDAAGSGAELPSRPTPTAVAHVRQGRFTTAIPLLEKLLAATPARFESA